MSAWRSAPTASAATRCAWAQVQGQGYIGAGARRRRRAGRRLLPRDALPAGGPGLGGSRPLPALHRPLRDRALRGADRGGHPARGRSWRPMARDDSRLPMSGMAAYTPGMEITGGSLGQGLERRRRHGAGAEAQGLRPPASTTCCPTANSTRARPGRPRCRPRITGSTTSSPSSTSTTSRRTGRRNRCWASSRCMTNGARSAGSCSASTATTSQPSSPPSTRRGAHAGRSRGSSSATRRCARACPSSRAARSPTSFASTPHEWDKALDILDSGRPA